MILSAVRIRITSEKIRKRVFESFRNNFGSWEEVRESLHLPKSTLEHYTSGRLTIPESLFETLKTYLPEDIKGELNNEFEKLPDNWGESKGGKVAYRKNCIYLEKGRLKGLMSLKKRYKPSPSFDFPLFPEICEVVGAFVGDGCFNLYKNKLYHIEFSGDNRYDLHYYENIVIPTIKRIIPHIKPHFIKRKDKPNTIRIVFYSKDLFFLLKDYFGFIPGRKTFIIKIPDKICRAGDLYLRAAIRGVFDTDGCVFLDKRSSYKSPYPRITFQTVSKSLYDSLSSYLSQYFTLYTSFNEKRQVYIIEIYGINQVKKWMSLIGFSNKRHLNRLAPVA